MWSGVPCHHCPNPASADLTADLCQDKAMRSSFRHFPRERKSKKEPLLKEFNDWKIKCHILTYQDLGDQQSSFSL